MRKWIILAATLMALPISVLAQVRSGVQSGVESGLQSGVQSVTRPWRHYLPFAFSPALPVGTGDFLASKPFSVKRK